MVQLIHELRWVFRGSFHNYGVSEDISCALWRPESYPKVILPTIRAVCPISNGLRPSECPPLRGVVPLRAYPASAKDPERQSERILSSFTSTITRLAWLRLSFTVAREKLGMATVGLLASDIICDGFDIRPVLVGPCLAISATPSSALHSLRDRGGHVTRNWGHL
jgi:hypothetical protein